MSQPTEKVTNSSVQPVRNAEGGGTVHVRNAEVNLNQDEPKTAPIGRVQSARADILEMQELDPKTLDPDRHYRWIRADESRIRRLERQGYEIENRRKGGPEPLGVPDNTADGSIRMGDLVLMSCPKDMREDREAALFQKNQSRLGMVATEQFRAKAQALGVQYDDQSKEQQ